VTVVCQWISSATTLLLIDLLQYAPLLSEATSKAQRHKNKMSLRQNEDQPWLPFHVVVVDFRHVAHFKTMQSVSKATSVENRTTISHFLTPPPPRNFGSCEQNVWVNFSKFNLGAVRHLGFDRKLAFQILQPSGTHNAPACQFLTQSGSAQLSYWRFSNLCRRYPGLWPRPLTPWPWTL